MSSSFNSPNPPPPPTKGLPCAYRWRKQTTKWCPPELQGGRTGRGQGSGERSGVRVKRRWRDRWGDGRRSALVHSARAKLLGPTETHPACPQLSTPPSSEEHRETQPVPCPRPPLSPARTTLESGALTPRPTASAATPQSPSEKARAEEKTWGSREQSNPLGFQGPQPQRGLWQRAEGVGGHVYFGNPGGCRHRLRSQACEPARSGTRGVHYAPRLLQAREPG